VKDKLTTTKKIKKITRVEQEKTHNDKFGLVSLEIRIYKNNFFLSNRNHKRDDCHELNAD